MEWITKHEIKLANTFCKNWEPTRARTNRIVFCKQSEQQLQKWKIIDYIVVPISWEKKKYHGQKLQGSKRYRSLASDYLCKVTTEERKLEI